MKYIRITFPAGRYHATTWGSHVNEGDVDWPPSPWRLLRGLLSTGFTHLHWQTVPDDAIALINKLSGRHPSYAIPASNTVHTRHYMPVHEGSKVKSSKIFDTAIRIAENQSLWMRFDVDLTDHETELLRSLVEHLAFLGRAESWVDAELFERCDDGLDWIEPNWQAMPAINSQLIRILSTQPSGEYLRWRSGAIAMAARTKAISSGKDRLTAAQQRKLESSFPRDLQECLMATTSDLQDAGWSQPPGSIWIDYVVPKRTPLVKPQWQLRTSSTKPMAALLALCSDSIRGRNLPHESMSVFVGENVHKACVAKIAKLTNDESELATFTGRDRQGKWIAKHRHAHFVPLWLHGDKRHIDHVLVYAPDGLGHEAQRAIADVEAIYAAGLPKVHVTLIGFGDLKQVRTEIDAIARSKLMLFDSERKYCSVTPYVASRHLKIKNDKYPLEENVADECRFRGLPLPRVTVVDRNRGQFRIARIGVGRQPPQAEGWFLQLEFDDTLNDFQLPLTLGYGSHFGLGLFQAISPHHQPVE